MCGICGIFDPLHHLPSGQMESDVQAMMHGFAYRGPDEQGTYFNPAQGIALGHVRLSIIDLSGGHQPMAHPDNRLQLTFNGEIYNFQSERAHLQNRGVEFRTRSDTEVILASYHQYGMDAWERLRGQFAIGLWDGRTNELLLVRDRLGEKPLVYSEINGTLFFASEVNGLLRCASLPKELDDSMLGVYFLTLDVPAPATLMKRMHKLPPGHVLRARAGSLSMEPYWKPKSWSIPVHNVKAVTDEFRERFEEAVRVCTVSDVPVGCYLSGGLDSTSVSAIVAAQQRQPLHTFAVFNQENHDQHPDWRYAQEAAQLLKTEHHNVFYGIDDLMAQLPEFIDRSDEPFEGPTVLVSYFLAQYARQYVKVVLTGNGGDELLGGYQSHYQREMKIQNIWQQFDRWVPRLLRRASSLFHGAHAWVNRIPLENQERRIEASIDYYAKWFNLICPDKADVTRQHLREALRVHQLFPQRHYFKQYMQDDLFVYHHRSITTMPDATGMACSLEARNPFLDYPLVEFLLQLPPDLLINQSQNKYILIKAMENRLTPSLLYRKKEGFSGMTGNQMMRWMRGHGRALFYDAVLDSSLVKEGYIRRGAVEELWKRYAAINDPKAAVYYQIPIWSAGLLALWYERHVAKARSG